MHRHFPLLLIAMASCAPFPALDDRITAAARAADYPDLVPLDGLVAQAQSVPAAAPDTGLDARIASLQNRADRLRAPVIDPATRDTLQNGVSSAPLR